MRKPNLAEGEERGTLHSLCGALRQRGLGQIGRGRVREPVALNQGQRVGIAAIVKRKKASERECDPFAPVCLDDRHERVPFGPGLFLCFQRFFLRDRLVMVRTQENEIIEGVVLVWEYSTA